MSHVTALRCYALLFPSHTNIFSVRLARRLAVSAVLLRCYGVTLSLTRPTQNIFPSPLIHATATKVSRLLHLHLSTPIYSYLHLKLVYSCHPPPAAHISLAVLSRPIRSLSGPFLTNPDHKPLSSAIRSGRLVVLAAINPSIH